MTTVSREEFDGLLLSMETERVKNARFRRDVTDILAHLGAENMPEIAARIAALQKDRILFHTGTADSPEEETAALRAAGLLLEARDTAGDARAALTAHGLEITRLYEEPAASAAGLRPVYVREDGRLVSCTAE